MAHREALRDFQSRLARRLQGAERAGLQAAWLAVEAGGQRYLLALTQAGEIYPALTPCPVPYTQPWFLGVANLRGGLYGVVDLAGFLGPQAPHLPGAVPPEEARLVVLNPALEAQCALRVDRLCGLRGPDTLTALAPSSAGLAPWLGPCYTDAQGATWQSLNLQALSQQTQFLRVGL